jgi:hypothetical protein
MARHRTTRSVKTVGLKPFVVDDVAAAALHATPEPAASGVTSLDGRERLDERLRRWETERVRFERSRKKGTPSADTAERSPPVDSP